MKNYVSKGNTQTTTCIGKKVEQAEILHTGGNVKCRATWENDLGESTKAEHTRWLKIPETHVSQKTCTRILTIALHKIALK